MREAAQTEPTLEQAIPFAAVREALGFNSNRTLKAACVRHGVPIVTWSARSMALTKAAYELLLARATGK
jgi:hypothetical protein